MSDEGEDAEESTSVADPNAGAWKLWCCAPALGILALFAVVTGLSFLNHEEEAPQPSSEMAKYHCREQVKESLKDPRSAEFSNESVTGFGDYTVTGTVRGKNSFGGTAVHEYTCTANFDESDGSYLVRAEIR